MSEWETRIPILVKTLYAIDYPKGYDEKDPEQCDCCGGHLFYILGKYGLVKEKLMSTLLIQGKGVTNDTKYYKLWSINIVQHAFYCATCGTYSHGVDVNWKGELVAKEFDSKHEADAYEEALDFLQYPTLGSHSKRERFGSMIQQVIYWINTAEKREQELQEHCAKIETPKVKKNTKASNKNKSK